MGFDVAAEAYDAFMGRYSALLAPRLVEFAGIRSGDRVLDVGCGTGMLTAELVRCTGAERVAAVDPSAPFVAAVRERYPGVDVRSARADSLPFDDAAFDAALAQLVVHFMPDPIAGIREMARVTRAGGAIAASVWDHASGRGPLHAFWESARALDPGADDESDLPGVREGHLEALFREAGLRDVTPAEHVARRFHPTFEDWWEPFERGTGPAGAYVASLSAARRDDLREACRRRLGAGPFEIEGVAWVVSGRAA